MKRTLTYLALLTTCTLTASIARADCGPSPKPRTMPSLHHIPTAKAAAAHTADPGPMASAIKDASIVGLWKVIFTSGGVMSDEGFDIWHADGTEVLNDTPPPATGNVCLGVWSQTGKSSYKLLHVSWTFDEYGNLNGTALIHEQVTVSDDGNSYQGVYSIDVFDLANNNVFHQDGQLSAQRITVD